jgi:hypothetical protein
MSDSEGDISIQRSGVGAVAINLREQQALQRNAAQRWLDSGCSRTVRELPNSAQMEAEKLFYMQNVFS